MSEGEKIPFEKEQDVRVKRTLKGSLTSRSMFAKELSEGADSLDRFEKAADRVVENLNDRAALIRDLSKSFMSAIRDRTPPENKGGVAIDFERDVRSRLNTAIYDMNNDVLSEEDGVGSQAGIALLSKTVFELRDRINALEYEVIKLRRELDKERAR